jgi:outer membrane lipoprotein-sorting protein
MTRKTLKTVVAAALGLCLVTLVVFYWSDTPMGRARAVNKMVAENVAARGGAEVWRDVSSLRLTGKMDLGKGMRVPYVLEQKRPNKMRLEFVFEGGTAVQCTDGKTGWKLEPFRGRTAPEPMTEEELRETADSADLYGPLFDYAARGNTVEPLGREPVEGQDAFKLKVTLPRGGVRWVYVDVESGLEIKVEALRTVAGRERRVETFYRDWQATEEGLLISHRQETRTEGSSDVQTLTVETVQVNPPIDDSRFAMPAPAPAGH